MTFRHVNPNNTGLYPQVQLEWSPTTGGTSASPSWVDLTDRLRDWAWQYGQNDELGQSQPGTGFALLSNADRKLDPSYASGAWFGAIKPRRQFRMQFKWGGVTKAGFLAYARGFPQSWPAQGKDAVVRVDFVDLLGVLEGHDLVAGFSRAAELSGARISAILDAVGVPAGLRSIDTGTVTVAAIDVTDIGTSALSHAKQVAMDEFGRLFVAKDGTVTFHDRHRRINASNVHMSFSDEVPTGFSTVMPYGTEFRPEFDDNYLWNYVRVDGPSSDDTPGVASGGTTSQSDYWSIAKTFSSQLANEPDRSALAQYYVWLYQQARLRVPRIPLQMPVWSFALATEISDQIPVTRFSSGSTMTLTQNIEGIAHACSPGGPWRMEFQTSPADTNTYWTLQTSTLGTIDSTNLIAP